MSEHTITYRLDEGQLGCIVTHLDRLTTTLDRLASLLETPAEDNTQGYPNQEWRTVLSLWPGVEGDTDMSFITEVKAGLMKALGLLPPDDKYLTPKSGARPTRVDAEANRAAWVNKAMGTLGEPQDDEPSWSPSGYTERPDHTSECISRWDNDTSFNRAYTERFPKFCTVCDGWGRRAGYNIRLSHVTTKVYDTTVCPRCVGQSLCPRCCAQLAERYQGDHTFMALRCTGCGWEPSLGGLRCVHCTCGASLSEVGK
jgi:hypothetical protein